MWHVLNIFRKISLYIKFYLKKCSKCFPWHYKLTNIFYFIAEDLMTRSMSSATSSSVSRRRTDIFPVVLSQRDSSSRKKSPGRALSMSRLDHLAQPRRPTPPSSSTVTDTAGSMSTSMTQLKSKPGPGNRQLDQQVTGLKPLNNSRGAKSMSSLAPRTKPDMSAPRTTRAERMRLKARTVGAQKREEMTQPQGRDPFPFLTSNDYCESLIFKYPKLPIFIII